METTSQIGCGVHYLAAGAPAPGNRQARPGWSALVPLAAVVALSAGCGSPSSLVSTDVETQIAEGLATQVGGTFRVDCPDEVPAQAGYTFSCTVLDGKTTVTVRVVESDDQGTFTWSVDGGASG